MKEKGFQVSKEAQKVRTCFITYESDDDSAETFMIVIGSIAENFKGVTMVEFQDDTIFSDGLDPLTVLHDMVTNEGRLTDQQREELERFTQQISSWDGEEGTT